MTVKVDNKNLNDGSTAIKNMHMMGGQNADAAVKVTKTCGAGRIRRFNDLREASVSEL